MIRREVIDLQQALEKRRQKVEEQEKRRFLAEQEELRGLGKPFKALNKMPPVRLNPQEIKLAILAKCGVEISTKVIRSLWHTKEDLFDFWEMVSLLTTLVMGLGNTCPQCNGKAVEPQSTKLCQNCQGTGYQKPRVKDRQVIKALIKHWHDSPGKDRKSLADFMAGFGEFTEKELTDLRYEAICI